MDRIFEHLTRGCAGVAHPDTNRSATMHPGPNRRLHRGAWAAVLGLLATSLVSVILPAAPAEADITVREVYGRPLSGAYQLQGRGWGHGRGMSQHGALGAATLGKTADQITSTYYPGTTKTVQSNTSIRVQLRDLNSSSESAVFTTQVYAATGLGAKDLTSGASISLDPTKTRWRVLVRDTDGKLILQGLSGTSWATRGVWTGPIEFMRSPDPLNSMIRVLFPSGYSRDYRYAVRAVKRTTNLNTIAVMPMESYLKGVVPRESISSWPAAALQSQAIAARSYASWHRNNNRTNNPALPYDICNSTACQVFGGSTLYRPDGSKVALEVASTNDAISKTANVVRSYGGGPIFAEFSSSNGGWSTDGGVPYMVAKADPWDGVTGSSVHSWDAKLPVSAIESRYSPKDAAGVPLWSFVRLTVNQRDGNGEWGGRVLSSTGAVTLDFVEKANPAVTHAVQTSGSGIYNAWVWPAHSDGLRSRWWHITPMLQARIISREAAPGLVHSPGEPEATVSVVMQNTGTDTWPVSGLHLALSSPAGGADPLVGGSTIPGTYVTNVTQGSRTEVAPGERAEFAVRFDGSSLPVGSRTAGYRVRIGTGPLFGSTAWWTITVQDPAFTGMRGAAPQLVSTTLPAVDGAPPALFADGRTVVVPRVGATRVRLTTRNTGNLAWPVGSSSRVMLGGSDPRDRRSPSFGSSNWVSATRASTLVASAAVAPGGTGTLDVVLNGNGLPVGLTSEAFEPVWHGVRWIAGHKTLLSIIRVDTTVSRLALTDLAPRSGITLAAAPTGRTTLTVRLRNVGKDPWTVGEERLGTSSSFALAYGWPSSTRTPALKYNRTRPGAVAVHPGEVGEWQVPVSAWARSTGTYTTTLRALGPDGFYGPSLPVTVKVVNARFSWSDVRPYRSVDVPSDGARYTFFDVKNTSNFAWVIGGALRSTDPSGRSPSRASTWLNQWRPGPATVNVTRPGQRAVRPGEVARFHVLLAGNDRPPLTASEALGMSWDGFGSTSLKVTLPYRVV